MTRSQEERKKRMDVPEVGLSLFTFPRRLIPSDFWQVS